MNLSIFANMLTIASAPVIEPTAPLPIEVTCMGRRLAGAKHLCCEDCTCDCPEVNSTDDGDFIEN